jgi:DNA invertase Pin-like site-specific DNA recombinase
MGSDAPKLRVAAYCRVSTSSEEQLSSYNSQIEYYTALINENPRWKFAGVFADEGVSGTSTKKRDEFNKMIRKCRLGRIDLILTKSVSRFARNTLDCVNYVRKLRDWGVAVQFEKENINTLEDPDETLFTMMGILAQQESMSLSRNVRLGIQHNFKAGKVPFHYILGYRKGEDGSFEIVPEEAEIVRFIYDSYLSGLSVGKIRNSLEAKGYLSSRGKETWSVAGIDHILTNEKYAGDALLQKTYVEDVLSGRTRKNTGALPQYLIQNNHPAIIDRDTFNRAQVERARRSSKRKQPSRDARTQQSKYSGKYALTEILTCGECGAFYRHTTWADKTEGGRRPVWRCVSRLEHGKKYCKHSLTLDEQQLHEIIRTTIDQVVFKELLFEALADGAVETGLPELIPDLSSMFWGDLPELEEYDDGYTRALLRRIEVRGKELHITFKDGTEVTKIIG